MGVPNGHDLATTARWTGLRSTAAHYRGPLRTRRTRIVSQLSRLSLRQPPALLLAMIRLNIALSSDALIVSPRWIASGRASKLSCPPTMIFSGSGTITRSEMKTLTWSFAASSQQMLPCATKDLRLMT